MDLRWLCACFASLLLSSSSAWAQAQATDKAAAEALFDRGLALMREGNFGEACARLEQSQAIEHGIGTMLYLAECYERLGRTASAWALFREASSQAAAAGQGERADTGRKRADKLERSLSMLTVEVPSGSAVAGLEIFRNGTPISRGAWGVPIPVDPGAQTIEARAPEREPWSSTVQLGNDGATQRVFVPPLAPVAVSASSTEQAASAPDVAAAHDSRAATGAAPQDGGKGATQRVIGIALAGAGLVGLAVGGGYGIRAIRRNNDAEGECPADRCSARGQDLTTTANEAARVSNGAFIAGGILVAAGVVVFLTAPRASKLSLRPSVSPQYAGLDVGGAF